MQIPLDFYRILGVPTRSTPEQLQQAFEDRLQQLPRQEYSNSAIAARKQLLEEAFSELSNPSKRQAYDQKWIDLEGEASGSAALGLPINVIDKKLAGVLLLLQEVGAYQQILDIGSTYLGRSIDLGQVPTTPGASEGDVILAMALANLELGREQWQQSKFETAGDSLQSGLALLEKEEQFPDVQSEIRRDLYKLRPYRILELLNEPDPEPRNKGLALLQTMLNDRDGIDGNQEDQSGLSLNDFLRFIQQLREYLTVAEQQELFEREAARPSAVASYLAVYALIARGVSQGKPRLVGRAKALLSDLGDRQDIAIEMGMCWLLLGQTEAAHQSIMMSQDEESLNFMRQYSEGALDLIPGLYLYTENWLQQEVYPYFRDLVDQKVSLQKYFDDPAIQTALESLEAHPVSVGKAAMGSKETTLLTQTADSKTKETSSRTYVGSTSTPGLASGSTSSRSTITDASRLWDADTSPWSADEESLDQVLIGQSSSSGGSTSVRSRPGNQRRSASIQTSNPDSPEGLRKKVQQRSVRNRGTVPVQRLTWVPWAIAALLGVGVVAGALALGKILKPSPATDLSSPSPIASLSPQPSSPAPSMSAKPSPSAATVPSPSVSPTSSPISATASPSPQPAAENGPLSAATAKELVQSWQSAKAQALGQDYDTSALKEVLAQPVRSQWEASATQAKQSKGYWKYTLNQLDIVSVDPLGKDQSVVKAVVKESGQYFENGKLVSSQSYSGDTYKVQYVAVRQKQQWLIKDMQVMN